MVYEEIREDDTDIRNIALHSGMSYEEIKTVKKHLFFDEHILYGNVIGRLDSDYDIAAAWRRL